MELKSCTNASQTTDHHAVYALDMIRICNTQCPIKNDPTKTSSVTGLHEGLSYTCKEIERLRVLSEPKVTRGTRPPQLNESDFDGELADTAVKTRCRRFDLVPLARRYVSAMVSHASASSHSLRSSSASHPYTSSCIASRDGGEEPWESTVVAEVVILSQLADGFGR